MQLLVCHVLGVGGDVEGAEGRKTSQNHFINGIRKLMDEVCSMNIVFQFVVLTLQSFSYHLRVSPSGSDLID